MPPGRAGERDRRGQETSRRTTGERHAEAGGHVEAGRRRRAPEKRERPERGPSECVGPGRQGPITAAQAARLAARYVTEMTGKKPENITSLERTHDGGWRVDVEVVELRRIPNTTDLLAIYQVELDEDGELLSYRRTQRYTRGQVQLREAEGDLM